MTEPNVAYDVTELSTDELRQIVKAVHNQYMAEMTGKAKKGDLLGAGFEELHDEFKFWSVELEKRIAHEKTENNGDT